MEVGIYTTTPEVESSKTDEDKKEDKETSEEGQETTTSTEQNSEEEANADNSDVQEVENPTVNQESTLQTSPAQG